MLFKVASQRPFAQFWFNLVKITPCSEAYKALPNEHNGKSNQALVDEVAEALSTGHYEKQHDSTIDLNKPLGKLKGNIFRRKQ